MWSDITSSNQNGADQDRNTGQFSVSERGLPCCQQFACPSDPILRHSSAPSPGRRPRFTLLLARRGPRPQITRRRPKRLTWPWAAAGSWSQTPEFPEFSREETDAHHTPRIFFNPSLPLTCQFGEATIFTFGALIPFRHGNPRRPAPSERGGHKVDRDDLQTQGGGLDRNRFLHAFSTHVHPGAALASES